MGLGDAVLEADARSHKRRGGRLERVGICAAEKRLRKNSRFVSGYAFRHTVSAALSIAPLGAADRKSSFSAACLGLARQNYQTRATIPRTRTRPCVTVEKQSRQSSAERT